MFKRGPSLTEQVKSHLKQRITNAEFEAGRIPSEANLASELGVSRNTIRDALSRLEIEGIIFRKQGAGTFVNKSNLLVKTRLEEIIPYDMLIREYGYTPSVQLLRVEEKQVSPEIARELKLEPDENLIIVHKLFLADASPIIFSLTYIPKTIIKQSYKTDDLVAPIFEFLPNHCQQTLAYYLTDIVPLLAPPWLVDHLNLEPHSQTALLSFEEIGHNQENEPVFKAVSYFQGDLLRLRLIRRYVGN